MRMDAWRLAAAGAAALAMAGVPVGAGAQVRELRTVEAYAARYSLHAQLGSGRQDLDGFGLRLQFDRFDPERPGRTLFDRTRGGVFATYTAKQGTPNISTLHVGVQTDASVLPRPLAGVLDPFISFGIGLLHTSQETLVATTTSQGHRITRTDFAFTPAVGTRLGVVNRVGARVDLRAPFVFGASTTANFVAEGGLYVSF
jgi:hypothetical protein